MLWQDEMDEIIALAEAAGKIPCEAVHRPGAPCCVCNPQRTNEGYSNAPYYFLERLRLARYDAALAEKFGPPILPRRGATPPLYAPGKTLSEIMRRFLMHGSIAADDLTVVANDPAEPVTPGSDARAGLIVLKALDREITGNGAYGTTPAGGADVQG